VAKEARGTGLGKQLMEKSMNWAKNHGYTQVYLESMPELTKAVSIYEKVGFKSLDGPLGNSGHCGCDIWMLKSYKTKKPSNFFEGFFYAIR
jgi:putative acetyltransferase